MCMIFESLRTFLRYFVIFVDEGVCELLFVIKESSCSRPFSRGYMEQIIFDRSNLLRTATFLERATLGIQFFKVSLFTSLISVILSLK